MAYGVIIEYRSDDGYGLIRRDVGGVVRFRIETYRDDQRPPPVPAPVQFERHASGAEEVVVLRDLTYTPGVVDKVSPPGGRPQYGFIKLQDGRTAYFSFDCLLDNTLARGTRVVCATVPGKEGREFALDVRHAPQRRPATAPTVGTAPNKPAQQFADTGRAPPPRPPAVLSIAKPPTVPPPTGQSERGRPPPSTPAPTKPPSAAALPAAIAGRKEMLAPVDNRSGPIGAASQRGTRLRKSFNDDSFLVVRWDEQRWLLAVADGVSKPACGWWASNKCLELAWRRSEQLRDQLSRVVGKEPSAGEFHAWLNAVREEFLATRRREARPDFRSADTTLTLAVVWGRRVFYGHTGDSPIYRLTNQSLLKRLAEVFEESRVRSGSHSGALKRSLGQQAFLVDQTDLEAGEMLVICTDGVMGREGLSKQSLLRTALRDETRSLQKRVEDVLAQIAASGEEDDLTLIAWQYRGDSNAP